MLSLDVDDDEIMEPVASLGLLALVASPTLPGDLNGDGAVDGADLGSMLGQWGPCAACGPCTGDVDDNGVVDGVDLGVLLGSWSS